MRLLINVISGMLMILFSGSLFSLIFGVNPVWTICAMFALSMVPQPQGVASAGLLKEIWLSVIMELYEKNLAWMNDLDDWSEFVENNTINLAEAGADPNVLVNNTSYPISTNERDDTPHTVTLDYLDTENTVVRNARRVELSYNKMKSVVNGHQRALRQKGAEKGAHAITPSSDGNYTPVLVTTGDNDGDGRKKLTEADVFRLAEAFDDMDIPEENWRLVLHTKHWNELVRSSPTLKEQRYRTAREGEINRVVYELAGFKIQKFKSSTKFDIDTGEKIAYGGSATNEGTASFAYGTGEAGRAIGDYDMFEDLKNPKERADIIGFQQRFLAFPKRNKYIAAIYSDAV